MNRPGFNPTYSDGAIYCLLRRVMAERHADPSANVMQPTPTCAPAISTPTRIEHEELSFDEILQAIRSKIAND